MWHGKLAMPGLWALISPRALHIGSTLITLDAIERGVFPGSSLLLQELGRLQISAEDYCQFSIPFILLWCICCHLDHQRASSSSSSWREAISRSIPPLRFAAKTICPQPAREHQSQIFPCPGGSDGSMWWEVGLERASSRVMAGCRLELCNRSGGSGLLERVSLLMVIWLWLGTPVARGMPWCWHNDNLVWVTVVLQSLICQVVCKSSLS